jgi:tetratricopeptide (TPR) repeat protein
MQRTALTVCLISIAFTLSACQEEQMSDPRFRADMRTRQSDPESGFFLPDAREVDLVEQLAGNREDYLRTLAELRSYYRRSGHSMKYRWADTEYEALKEVPQYKYLMAAETAPGNLAAMEMIAEADELYLDGIDEFRHAMDAPLGPDKDVLRQALYKFNRIIQKYPSSDKVDDAAFRAGEIYEIFKDYAVALTYYQRAYQWDDATPYPARFKAAKLLDEKFRKREEALELYREAALKETRYPANQQKANERIQALTTPPPPTPEEMEEVKKAQQQEMEREQQEAERMHEEYIESVEE